MTKLAEVYFNHASWQLNQEDGQLAIADVTFTNFRFGPLDSIIHIVGHEFEVVNDAQLNSETTERFSFLRNFAAVSVGKVKLSNLVSKSWKGSNFLR